MPFLCVKGGLGKVGGPSDRGSKGKGMAKKLGMWRFEVIGSHGSWITDDVQPMFRIC